MDGSDNIYIADGDENTRMIMQNGMVSTLVAVNGTTIFGAGNHVIKQGGFASNCMAASPSGDLYLGGVLVTTSFAGAILKVTFQ